MKKYGILALVVFVFGILSLLVFLLRSGPGSEATAPAPPGASARSAASPGPRRASGDTAATTSEPPGASAPDRPGSTGSVATAGSPGVTTGTLAPDSQGPSAAASDGEPRDYIRPDGIRVRDHRAGVREPDLTRAIPGPRGQAKLSRKTVADLLVAARAIITPCASSLDRQAFGERPMISSDVIVTVYSHRLSIDSVAIRGRDVPVEALDVVTSCATRPIKEIVVDAPLDSDVSSYTVTLPVLLSRSP